MIKPYINLNLLKAQSRMFLEFLRGKVEELSTAVGTSDAMISVSAFYNGREESLCLSITPYAGNPIHFIVGEHRNSDNLFLDMIPNVRGINPPTVKDLTDVIYEKRKFYSYLGFQDAFDDIINAIQKHMEHINE